MQKGFLAFLVLLTLAPSAPAQSSDETVAEIATAYRQLQYERAEEMARDALENYGDYTVDELADIHTILGLIAYNNGQQEEARRQFLSALQIDPDLELDPVLVPPKIVAYFEDLRSDLESGTSRPSEAELRYVLVRDPRVDAALRSMIVPGWGQFHKGQEVKAGVFAGLFTFAAGGALVSHVKMRRAFDRYDSADTSAEAERLYGPYNRWYRTRNGLVQGAVVVWLASYVDALLAEGASIESERAGFRATSRGFSLHVSL